MDYRIVEKGFKKENIEFFGSKFLIGNGYFGYRGTLEEFKKEQLVGCTLSEVYDDSGSGWREPINVANPLCTSLYYEKDEISALHTKIIEHEQTLDVEFGICERNTSFITKDNKKIQIASKRFASVENIHLLLMQYEINSDSDIDFVLKTKIDTDIWDINGPHFSKVERKIISIENKKSVIKNNNCSIENNNISYDELIKTSEFCKIS